METIYLVSDIHTSNKVFEMIGTKITESSPLYILGDILDNKNSTPKEYRLMIANIYNGLNENKVKLFTGNHDILSYNLLAKPDYRNNNQAQAVFENIASVYSSFTYDTIKKLFGPLFFQELYEIQSNCINSGTCSDDVDYFEVVEEYFNQIKNILYLMDEDQYQTYKQLLYISSKSKMYEVITWKNKKYMLSHTGSKDNPWSTEIYSHYFEREQEIDYYVIGHIAHSSIAKVSATPISEFNFECGLDNIEGTYVYSEKLKLINIDNDSRCNIIKLV